MTFNTNMDMVLNAYRAIHREELFLPFPNYSTNQTTGKIHNTLYAVILMVHFLSQC